ncbi:MAG: radical SAM protein [Rhodocyclales bacterium]|nr:radical SAM protein [Rhodocyclales bacterium]
MNIAITNQCSRACAFCYQSSIMKSAGAGGWTQISLDAFNAILDFCEASGEEKVTLVGGEPTLHRQFGRLLEIIDERPALKQALLFTNGIFSDRMVEEIVGHGRKLIVSINVLDPCEEKPVSLLHLRRNLGRFRDAGLQTDLSFVIHRPDFDHRFLLDYAREFDIQAVRWALAFPVVRGASHIPVEQLRPTGVRIAAMLRELSAAGLRSYVDCPLPYCMFSDEDMGFVASQSLSVINWGNCGLTLEISPELTVKACPSQREEERVPLSWFADVPAMERYFFTRMSAYKAAHQLLDECAQCRYYRIGHCQGGCLGYGLDSCPELPPTCRETLGDGDIDGNWKVVPLVGLALERRDGAALLLSPRSPQVAPEPLSGDEAGIWSEIAAGPRFASLVDGRGRETVQAFVRRLQRGGFVDLVRDRP